MFVGYLGCWTDVMRAGGRGEMLFLGGPLRHETEGRGGGGTIDFDPPSLPFFFCFTNDEDVDSEHNSFEHSKSDPVHPHHN